MSSIFWNGVPVAKSQNVIEPLSAIARALHLARRPDNKTIKGEKHLFRVDAQRVDDCVVSTKLGDEGTLGTLPLLDVISTRRISGKGKLCWVDCDRTYRLLMVSQRHHRFPRRQVPWHAYAMSERDEAGHGVASLTGQWSPCCP
jgi:hypothetical protein